MTELALVICGIAIIALVLLDAAAPDDEEEPLWMGYVSGPYVRKKYTIKHKGGF